MRFALVPSAGIGDGLLLQIAARHLCSLGHEVTTFSSPLLALAGWFPDTKWEPTFSAEEAKKILAPFEAIFLQHDNSSKSKIVKNLPQKVFTLYGSHHPSKHPPLQSQLDFVCHPFLSMAENIKRASGTLFPGGALSLDNGMSPPPSLLHHRHPKRIAIHPVSSSPQKNWRKKHFLKLADRLCKEGFEPVMIVPPHQAHEWGTPLFETLHELASFLYESGALIGNDSGPAHLASNLHLPTLVIGPSRAHLHFWRPGWERSRICAPRSWVDHFRWTRERWSFFIGVEKVMKEFRELLIES
jgi:heptosyltransferase-3